MIRYPNNKNQHETNDIHRSSFSSTNLNINGNIQNLVQHNNSNNSQTFFNNSTQHNPQLSHEISIPQNLYKTDFSTTQNEGNKYHPNDTSHHQNNNLRRGDSISSTITNQNEEFSNEAYFESAVTSTYEKQKIKFKEDSKNIVRRIIFEAVKEVGWDKNGFPIQEFKQLYPIIKESKDSDEFKDYLYYIQYGCFVEYKNKKIIEHHKNNFLQKCYTNNKDERSSIQRIFADVKSSEVRKIQDKCFKVKKYKVKIRSSDTKMQNECNKRSSQEHTYLVEYDNKKEHNKSDELKTFLGLGSTEKRDVKKMRMTITKQEEEIEKLVSTGVINVINEIKFVFHMMPFLISQHQYT